MIKKIDLVKKFSNKEVIELYNRFPLFASIELGIEINPISHKRVLIYDVTGLFPLPAEEIDQYSDYGRRKYFDEPETVFLLSKLTDNLQSLIEDFIYKLCENMDNIFAEENYKILYVLEKNKKELNDTFCPIWIKYIDEFAQINSEKIEDIYKRYIGVL